MSRNRLKAKGRSENPPFLRLPKELLEHPRFQALSPKATKALLYLGSQYRGHNNGDLQIAWKLAKRRGWTSNGSLRAAVMELIRAGFVVLTRQGGRNRCSLYALTWFAIDDCNGKLDIPAASIPPNHWKRGEKLSEPLPVQCAPSVVQSGVIQPSGLRH